MPRMDEKTRSKWIGWEGVLEFLEMIQLFRSYSIIWNFCDLCKP